MCKFGVAVISPAGRPKGDRGRASLGNGALPAPGGVTELLKLGTPSLNPFLNQRSTGSPFGGIPSVAR